MLKWAGWYIFCGEENGWIITIWLQEVLCKQCYVKTEDFYKLRVKLRHILSLILKRLSFLLNLSDTFVLLSRHSL